MRLRKKPLALIGVAAVTAILTTGAAIAASDDTEAPIEGSDLQKAKDAALAETGGGTVTEAEMSHEEGTYEVEVDVGNGTEVEVQLDDTFQVVSTEREEADSGEGDDD